MSKLDKLIAELCPDGVEYNTLEEVCFKITDGSHFSPNAVEEGYYMPSVKDMREDGFDFSACKMIGTNDYQELVKNGCKPQIGDLLVAKDGSMLKYAFTIKEELDIVILSSIAIFRPNYSIMDSQFLGYYITSKRIKEEVIRNYSTKGGVPRIVLKNFKKIKIPVPPLEVQREIVQILDKFTKLTAELQAELQAELSARRKQYEFYSNFYFETMEETTPVYTVEDVIISLKTGLNPRKNFTLNESGSSLPYITGKDIYNNQINISNRTDLITEEALTQINKRAQLHSGLLLFASTGTGTVGRMAIVKEYNNDWGMSETLYGITVDEQKVTAHYLMYFLYSFYARNQFEPKITKGSVPHLKVNDLLSVKIPVPSLKEQARAVKIIKAFDDLISDISTELLSEIEAGNKQYEYYRDKLLTFKEL